jgi:hypothetical protein
MQSNEINELAQALVSAQAEFSAVPKGSVNPFFKSKYAALPDVVASASPVLAKHGLAISQHVATGMNGTDILVTYLIHTSGQYIAHDMTLHMVKDDPQAQGSAITYARRYSYMSALGLVADEDDDANGASKPKTSFEAKRTTPSAASNADVDAIVRAAELAPDNEFLVSLAKQYAERGSLSDKQLASGRKIAAGVLKSAPQSFVEAFNATEEEPF